MKMKLKPFRTIFFYIITFALLALASPSYAGTYSGGTGEPNDPFLIDTPEDMNAIGADSNDWDKHFLMTADINMAGYTYTTALIAPDTDNTNWDPDGTPFAGTFNGNNHIIHNLTINTTGANNKYLGLFGYTENGQINNLSVENISIRVVEKSHFIGGLVGFNDTTTVTNCYVSGEISAGRYSGRIGGMIGRNIDGEIANCHTAIDINVGMSTFEIGGLIGGDVNGLISNCYTTGAVSGEYKSCELGGLIGRCNYGTITDCYATGTVSGYVQLGGLIGHNVDNIVTNCYATGTLTGGVYGIGGLIGDNAYAQINNCYAMGAIFGEYFSSQLGGLIGRNNGGDNGVVMNSFATGTVTGGNSSEYLGGLIGDNVYAITIACYATGTVTSGDDSYLIGGLVGENYCSNITDCYANSSVVSGDNSDSIGGLVGYNRYSSYWELGIISNCYAIGEVLGGNNSQNLGGFAGYINDIEHINGFWNIETSGLIDGVGNMSPDPEGVIGKTTAEMMTQTTFTDAGWDFETPIWKFCSLPDYPKLAWQECPGLEAPVLQAKPEFTLGTSNTVYWDAVADANAYFAECAEDTDFTIIFADTGWIADTNCTFEGLEVGQTYFYRVKAGNDLGFESEWSDVESSRQVTLAQAVQQTLDPNSLINKNMVNALTNKLNAVMNMIDSGRYAQVINKLENDILQKTNGCAEAGAPDKNDWITTCEQQDQIYPLIIEMIDYLEGLI